MEEGTEDLKENPFSTFHEKPKRPSFVINGNCPIDKDTFSNLGFLAL